MRQYRTQWTVLGVFLGPLVALGEDSAPSKTRVDPPARASEESNDTLAMTPAVACRSIEGYEDYEILPDAALTSDEKLLVYYRPLEYKVEHTGSSYHGHLTQDGRIRRRGEKAVLQRKDKLLEYEFKMNRPPNPVFLRNTVSLKGLKPGEYEFDIILHDKLADGATVTQTLEFRIIPAVLPKPEEDAGASDKAPPSPKRPKTKAKRANP